MYPTLLHCQQACSVPRRSCLGAMLAFTRCQRTCSVSRRVYKHFPQLLLTIFFFFLYIYLSRVTLKKSWYFIIYFFRPHQNFLTLSFIQLQKCFISKTTYYDRETSFLSYSFMEMGQRKKIIDDHDKLYSEIEINQLLSNNRFFEHR